MTEPDVTICQARHNALDIVMANWLRDNPGQYLSDRKVSAMLEWLKPFEAVKRLPEEGKLVRELMDACTAATGRTADEVTIQQLMFWSYTELRLASLWPRHDLPTRRLSGRD